ncbi:hypothetical protein RUM43_007351 [Polyplax serrata]|uniref:PRELI/MSF1 domain-containing protein n=1 Tax=Polyplax serrata TaxID=468196 RepID=A0AAN8PMJ5_POLSC
MKYFENSNIFHYTWEQVAQCFWKRYPNPMSTHVLSEDTLSYEVRDGKLYTKRLLVKTSGVPKWGQKFVSTRFVKVLEESVMDPKERIFVTYTRNICMAKIMSVIEKVTYKTSPENSKWTVAHRSAWIDSEVNGFRTALTTFGLRIFKKNCKRMVKGYNWALQKMFPNSNQRSKTDLLKDLAKTKANGIFVSCEPPKA